MHKPAVVITAARRTPVGSLNGVLSGFAAHELGAAAIRAAVADSRIAADQVSEVLLGQVLTGLGGMNPARQASRMAGLPDVTPAALVNQVCGSGLRAVAMAVQQLQLGEAQIVVAGGQESMSRAPHAARLRSGQRLGDVSLVDTLMADGLTDAFGQYPMGVTAETIARRYALTREAQDAFALQSQHRAASAQREGRFEAELVGVEIAEKKTRRTVSLDEHVRPDQSAADLARLRPAFSPDGRVTAGNSSGINDGAAALVLMREEDAVARDLTPLARVAAWAHAGVAPEIMGMGPVPAVTRVLERAGWSAESVDLWEVNEAFAAQCLAVIAELELDPARVNVNGGGIALGHPIGASGARILVTLIHEMRRRGGRRGVATACIGGGMGIAMAVENA